jgi:hypothetical protein
MRIEHLTKRHVLAGAGVVAGIALVTLIRLAWSQSATVTAPPEAPSAAEVVARHLEAARQEAAAGLEPQFAVVHEFFAQASLGTRAFAEDALGLGSKWELINGYVFADDRHRKYLEERFAARVFRAEDIEQTIQHVVAAYLNHLDNVDATFLVNLRADLDGIPTANFSAGIEPAVIQQSIAAAIGDAVDAGPGAVGADVVNLAAGEALTQLAVWLGAKAGMLPSGKQTTLADFGTQLVVGFVADAIISRAYDEMFDPVGEMSRQVDETLQRLEALIVSGDGEEPGLYQRLRDYAERRAEARKAAINAALNLTSGPST